MIQATYNGLSLNTKPYTLQGYDGYDMPNIDIKTVNLARVDGAVQVAQRYTSKTITISGQIKADTPAALIGAIDTLKAYMYVPRGKLVVIDEDGVERTHEATPQNTAVIRERGNANMASYSVQFYCPKPYSTSENLQLLNATITAPSVNLGFTIAGTYPASPYITLTINSITAGQQSITIANQTEERGITVTGTFAAGTVITIDTDRKEVYVGTIKTDYTGSFPRWNFGAGSLAYSDTANARNVGIVVTYNVRRI